MNLENHSLHYFLEKYQIKNESGILLDFKDHAFQWDMYKDFSKKLVIYKAAQVGFSTLAIIKTLWLAKTRGLDIIYTLPTGNDVKDFVGGKVNRIIAQNPVFQQWVADKDSVEQKRVGNSVIYYRGTWTDRAALMVSASLLVHDEEDRSKQDTIAAYASRSQHSVDRMEWHFSNPSVPGNGVDKYWDRSDKKHWFIKCPHCNERQFLDWPDSIDLIARTFVCKYCKGILSREDRRVGEWVQKVKNAEYSGYWVSLLMAPWVEAGQIIDYYNTKSKEYFWNMVLGLPYVGQGNTVTPDVIFRNLTENINNQERVVIGCDSGIVKHFVCGNTQGLFYYGKTEKWEDIARLLKKFERSILVVDAMPDITGPRQLREQFPGRVFLCHYARDRKTMQLVRWGENAEAGNVIVDRNRMIQLVVDEFADRRIPLQGTRDDWAEYYSMWDDVYRVTVEDALGVPQFEWAKKTGNDHFVHATSYWRAGMSRFGGGNGFTAKPHISLDTQNQIIQDDEGNVRLRISQLRNEETNDWRT